MCCNSIFLSAQHNGFADSRPFPTIPVTIGPPLSKVHFPGGCEVTINNTAKVTLSSAPPGPPRCQRGPAREPPNPPRERGKGSRLLLWGRSALLRQHGGTEGPTGTGNSPGAPKGNREQPSPRGSQRDQGTVPGAPKGNRKQHQELPNGSSPKGTGHSPRGSQGEQGTEHSPSPGVPKSSSPKGTGNSPRHSQRDQGTGHSSRGSQREQPSPRDSQKAHPQREQGTVPGIP